MSLCCKYVSRAFLKQFVVGALVTELGSLFQALVVLFVRNCSRVLVSCLAGSLRMRCSFPLTLPAGPGRSMDGYFPSGVIQSTELAPVRNL